MQRAALAQGELPTDLLYRYKCTREASAGISQPTVVFGRRAVGRSGVGSGLVGRAVVGRQAAAWGRSCRAGADGGLSAGGGLGVARGRVAGTGASGRSFGPRRPARNEKGSHNWKNFSKLKSFSSYATLFADMAIDMSYRFRSQPRSTRDGADARGLWPTQDCAGERGRRGGADSGPCGRRDDAGLRGRTWTWVPGERVRGRR